MPAFSIEISNPLKKPEPDALVLGVIRLSDTEKFSYHTLDAELIGRDHNGEVQARVSQTLRMAAIVPAGVKKRIPVAIAFPADAQNPALRWELRAILYFKDGTSITTSAAHGAPAQPPVWPAESQVAQNGSDRPLLRHIERLSTALFLLAIGVALLQFNPEAPLAPLSMLAFLSMVVLLQGITVWAFFLANLNLRWLQYAGTGMTLAFWAWLFQYLVLRSDADSTVTGQTLAFFAQYPLANWGRAICLPMVGLAAFAPWAQLNSNKTIRYRLEIFLALHGLCLLPIVLLQATDVWHPPLLLGGALLVATLLNSLFHAGWQHLTRWWISGLGLSSIPSLVALLAWDPMHGWMAALGVVVLVGGFMAMAYHHHRRLARFGTVQAMLLPDHVVHCERLHLGLTVNPPDRLVISAFQATARCIKVIPRGRGSKELKVMLELPMRGEWPAQLPPHHAHELFLKTIIPPDALRTVDSETEEVYWEVEVKLKAEAGPTWQTVLPLVVE